MGTKQTEGPRSGGDQEATIQELVETCSFMTIARIQMEATPYQQMEPDDSRAPRSTEWVLADSNSYQGPQYVIRHWRQVGAGTFEADRAILRDMILPRTDDLTFGHSGRYE